MISANSSLLRLAFMMLGIVAAALSLMLVLTTWALNTSLEEVARTSIREKLNEFAMAQERKGFEGLKEAFASRTNEPTWLVHLYSRNGEVLLQANSPELNIELPISESRNLIAGEVRWISGVPGPKHGTLLLGGRGMRDGSQLWIGRSNEEDQALVQRLQKLIGLLVVFTTLLAAGPVIWFARQVLHPVRRLIDSARRIAHSDSLEQRLETTPAIPELQEFANVFNAGLNRINELSLELEAANDQLAHELRTPMARIRGNLEALLASDNIEVVRDAAARGIEEIERSVALVQSILSIRAGDVRSMRLHLEMRHLHKLLADIVDLYHAAAETRGIELQLLPGNDVLLLLDPQRMRQAVSNLLDNALAYTPRGGAVTVALESTQQTATIYVRDTGPGLSETDAQRIWRRFSRGSAAVASNFGIGLGLSLVRAVAHAHHGQADARNREEGGAEFWIRLPIQNNRG